MLKNSFIKILRYFFYRFNDLQTNFIIVLNVSALQHQEKNTYLVAVAVKHSKKAQKSRNSFNIDFCWCC